jgi:hypothetical protein
MGGNSFISARGPYDANRRPEDRIPSAIEGRNFVDRRDFRQGQGVAEPVADATKVRESKGFHVSTPDLLTVRISAETLQ